MGKKLIAEALAYITGDIKIVRLSLLTTFFHTLIVVWLLAFNVNNLLVERFAKGVAMWPLTEGILLFLRDNNVIWLLILGAIIFLIWYGILYPIGQWALVHYLHDKNYSISSSLWKWTTSFFPMFELSALQSTFSLLSFALIIIRAFMLGINNSILMQIVLAIRGICIVVISLLWPYTKYFIILHEEGVFEAIKSSFKLSLNNFVPTVKLVFIELMLLIRFFVNTAIVIGIPLILWLLAIKLGIADNTFVRYFLISLTIILLLGTAYINALVEAFFSTYWYRAFDQIMHNK